jgi:hypothetical protein
MMTDTKTTIEVVVAHSEQGWTVNGEGNFGNKLAAYARVEEIRAANKDAQVQVTVLKKDGSIQLQVTKARGSKIVVGRVQAQQAKATARAGKKMQTPVDYIEALLEMLPEDESPAEATSIADYIAPRQGAVKKLTSSERWVRALEEMAD